MPWKKASTNLGAIHSALLASSRIFSNSIPRH